MAEHLTLKCAWLGERKGVLEMRRMYGGYFKGFRHASRLRMLLMEGETRDGVLERLLNFREDEPDVQVSAPVRPARIDAALRAKLPVPAGRSERATV